MTRNTINQRGEDAMGYKIPSTSALENVK